MDGLFFYIAANQIEREMRQTAHAAGPDGGHNHDDERGHLSRLRRLISREAVPPAAAAEETGHAPALRPAAGTTPR